MSTSLPYPLHLSLPSPPSISLFLRREKSLYEIQQLGGVRRCARSSPWAARSWVRRSPWPAQPDALATMAELQSRRVFATTMVWFAGTGPCFCYHPPPSEICFHGVFSGTGDRFLLQSFCFSVTTGICRFFATSHLHDIRDRRLCFLMNLCQFLLPQALTIATFIFSGDATSPVFSGRVFCCNHVLILLEPETNFATSMF